jgi:hypothetical protein
VFLFIQVAAAIAYVVLYFTDKNEFKKLCIGDSTDQKVIDTCNSSTNLNLWVVIVSSVVPILFSACTFFITSCQQRLY